MRHDKFNQTENLNENVIPHQARADDLPPNSAMKSLEQTIIEDEQASIPEPEPMNELEVKARQTGWLPKSEWNGDPDDWVSARRYVETGELIRTNKNLSHEVQNLKNDFNTRMNNLKTLHEQQLQVQLESLKSERDRAVEEADTEKYRQLNEKIDNLQLPQNNPYNQQPTPQQPPQQQPSQGVDQDALMNNIATHPSMIEWKNRNGWINENTPKSAYAERQFMNWLNNNINNPQATLEQGLAYIDSEMQTHFPEQNYQRQMPSMTQRRGGPGGRPTNTLSMADLTREERLTWETMGNSWKSETEFLQAVKDAREADKL